MNFFIRLIGAIALTCSIISLAYSSESQDYNESGFQLKIIREDVKDSASLKFISLDDIKKLTHQAVQLPDHKSKQLMIWEGVYLREVIEKYQNIDWAAIHRLIIKSPDGYSSVISGIRMKQAESALCTFALQGKEWTKKFGYIRIIFPDLHEMHWMNNPAEVELVLKSDAHEQRIWKFFFFESPVFASLHKSVGKETAEWSVNDLLTSLGCTKIAFTVFTGDGQVREYLFDDIAQKMKFASDSLGCWKIRGERIPIGFRLRKIFFLSSAQVGLFTKPLTPEEQLLWQKLFASNHPFMSQGIPLAEIALILASGEKIPATNFEAYQAGKISLYQLMQIEKDARSDLMGIEVSW